MPVSESIKVVSMQQSSHVQQIQEPLCASRQNPSTTLSKAACIWHSEALLLPEGDHITNGQELWQSFHPLSVITTTKESATCCSQCGSRILFESNWTKSMSWQLNSVNPQLSRSNVCKLDEHMKPYIAALCAGEATNIKELHAALETFAKLWS